MPGPGQGCAVSGLSTGPASAAALVSGGGEAACSGVVGMGHIEDRWWRALPDGGRVGRDRVGVGLRWRARYRDADGRQRAQSFARKKDAQRFLALAGADLLRGSYVDPGLSRRSLRAYAEWWLPAQPIRESTRRCYDSQLRNWILPVLGHRCPGLARDCRARQGVQVWSRGLP